MSLDAVTRQLEARLHEFTGFNYSVLFDLGEDGVIAIDGRANPPTMSHDADEADCTIRLSAGDLEKLIDGALNPMMAYTLGKLKIDGSMGVAMKVASLLEE